MRAPSCHPGRACLSLAARACESRRGAVWPFGWSQRNHEIAGCGLDPTPECHWTWGATEGWVWEYYPASLAKGAVDFEIEVANTTAAGGALGDRNIDAILLTNNLTDIRMRAWRMSSSSRWTG